MSTTKHSYCNQTRKIQGKVTKSFILETVPTSSTGNQASLQGVHGLHLVLNSWCSQPCSVTIHHSHFYCSWVTINNIDIWIENSKFQNSFLRVQANLRLPMHDSKARIIKTEFKLDQAMDSDQDNILGDRVACKALNYICVSGTWDSVEILQSMFQGHEKSQIEVSGLQVADAKLQSLNLIGVQVTALTSVLVIGSSSDLGVLHVTESMFVSNRDGIDIGQGVRHAIVSSSEFNNTDPWFGKAFDYLEHCSSALKGSVQTLVVWDCVFANNRGSGKNCKGAALHLKASFRELPLLGSGNANINMSEQEIFRPSIRIVKSVFWGNRVSAHNNVYYLEVQNAGGAVAILGWTMLVKFEDCLFEGNEAFEGGGLYVGLTGDLQKNNAYNSQLSPFTLIIQKCIFNSNIANNGGGFKLDLRHKTVTHNASIQALIVDSSFSRNTANTGAGSYFSYSNISLNSFTSVMTKFYNSGFYDNSGDIRVGGLYLEYGLCNYYPCPVSILLMPHALVRTEIHNCSFRSNKAYYYGALYVWVRSISLRPYSSLDLQLIY